MDPLYPHFVNGMFSWGYPQMGIFLLIVAWSLVWKGIALWKAARAGQMYWFVALLVINTVGVLEIIYIYFFAGKKPAATGASQTNNPISQ